MHRLAVAAAVLGLSACGGGGGSAVGTPGDGGVLLRFEDRVRALDAAAARMADLEFTAAPPASGSAVYRGHMGATAVIDGAPPALVLAEVELTARFASGTFGGTFANLGAAGGEVSGAGSFEDGRFGAAGIEARVAGTLRRDGTDHVIAGGFRGVFLGPDAGGVAGGIEATLARGGAASGRLDGEVWAEK